MKQLNTGLLVLMAGAYAVQAQGCLSMGDFGSAIATYIYVSYKTLSGSSVPIGGSSKGPAPTLSNYAEEIGNGNDWTVQLYGAVGANLPSSTLVPLPGMTATFANGVSDNIPGTWSSTAVGSFMNSGTGSVATVQLYVWYNDGGVITSFSQALANNVPTADSSTANVILNAPPEAPAPLPTGLGNFSVTLIPEPNTIALGVVAASAFLMRLLLRDKG